LNDANELFCGHPDVAGNLSKQYGRYVAAFVEWHCCAAPIRVTELFVGPSLSDLNETELVEPGNHFLWFEDRKISHRQN
jgi:hypothetical protein